MADGMKPRGNPSWSKGKSGNPNGRPKDPFPKLIRESTREGNILVKKALSLLESEDENIQIKALQWLSDRGWGKAAQPLEFGGQDGGPIAVAVVRYEA